MYVFYAKNYILLRKMEFYIVKNAKLIYVKIVHFIKKIKGKN
jgi:hypothetical protein